MGDLIAFIARGGVDPITAAAFATAVQLAATNSTEELQRIVDVQRSWAQALTGVRRDAAARRLVAELCAHPVVSALTPASILGLSRPAAIALLG
jgi:hypothetical protein